MGSKDLELIHEGKTVDVLKDVGSMGLDLWHKYQEFERSKGGGGTGFKADEKENVGLAVGEVIAFTGCRSDQTSADVGDVTAQFGIKEGTSKNPSGTTLFEKAQHVRGDDYKNAGGALTSALVEVLESGVPAELSYFGVLEKIREELSTQGFSQVPQVATSLV